MTERLDEKLKVARIVLEKLVDGDMRWTPLMKATLGDSGTPSTFRTIVDWLLVHRYVTRPSRGIYRITGKGRSFLKVLDSS